MICKSYHGKKLERTAGDCCIESTKSVKISLVNRNAYVTRYSSLAFLPDSPIALICRHLNRELLFMLHHGFVSSLRSHIGPILFQTLHYTIPKATHRSKMGKPLHRKEPTTKNSMPTEPVQPFLAAFLTHNEAMSGVRKQSRNAV